MTSRGREEGQGDRPLSGVVTDDNEMSDIKMGRSNEERREGPMYLLCKTLGTATILFEG